MDFPSRPTSLVPLDFDVHRKDSMLRGQDLEVKCHQASTHEGVFILYLLTEDAMDLPSSCGHGKGDMRGAYDTCLTK